MLVFKAGCNSYFSTIFLMITGLIVILGSPNSDKGELTEMGLGRLALGHELFRDLKSAGWKILLTGGFGDHFNRSALPHAEYAKLHLLSEGATDPDFVEPALSSNTIEDALKAREIAEKYKVKQLLVVSSDFHIPRVEFIFRHVFHDCGLAFAGAPFIESRDSDERELLCAHENRALSRLRSGAQRFQ